MADDFAKAMGRRITLTESQKKKIRKMYEDAAKELKDEISHISRLENMSAAMRRQYLKKLLSLIGDAMDGIDSDLEKMVEENAVTMSQQVIKDNSVLLFKMGFEENLCKTAYAYIPKTVVNEIITGKLYKGRWKLSRAIWDDNALKKKELENIVAKGVAMQKSTIDIAKDLEKYVNPAARKPWDWSKVYPGSRTVIDYNAQRLARTMVSHAYQESFVRVTKKNPFITAYRWNISNSDRVCPVCIDRATTDKHGLGEGIFPKNALPLDHPNGMCTFTSVIPKDYNQIADNLADWVIGKGSKALNRRIDFFVKDMRKQE